VSDRKLLIEGPDLGACCACGGYKNVRNVVLFDFSAPVPGTGWGCVVCHIPNEGAVAALCDECVAYDQKPTRICFGYPGENRRVPMPRPVNRKPYHHDSSFH